MGRSHKPRSGTLQYWPRKRAKRQYPRINSWPQINATKLLSFMGYKVGMTHVELLGNNPTTKESIITSATIVECPPIKPFSLRFYKKTPYGFVISSEILSKNLDKELSRKIKFPKKHSPQNFPTSFDEVRLVAYTQPKLTSLPKKKPEIMEIKISKNDVEYAKSLLDKEINFSDVFEVGKYVDVHAVTKGKGLEGPIMRQGLSLKEKKSEKGQRRPGSLGCWTASNFTWTVAHSGQRGYHTRTEHNKLLLKICKPEEINHKSGFRGYGLARNPCILIKGSIPGPAKRLIRIAYPLRQKTTYPITINYIHKN